MAKKLTHQNTFSFTFSSSPPPSQSQSQSHLSSPSPSPSPSPSSSSPPPPFSCPPSLSSNACIRQKQKETRQLIAERLPFASFSRAEKLLSRNILPQQQSIPTLSGKDSISEFGFKTLFYQAFEDVSEDSIPEGSDDGVRKWHKTRDKRQKRIQGRIQEGMGSEEVAEEGSRAWVRGKKRFSIKLVHLRVGNASLKRLLSGALSGAVSRTAVAPLETIRTHLMVGTCGHTFPEVFHHIMHTEGWRGLFRGNGVNVIRVAPSKAIELFAYDTIKKVLDKAPFVSSHIPVPTSSIAGAAAGICSTICTYPLELLKTRLTIQRGVYKNLTDAFIKICEEEGPKELYRGLTPSLIGVVPYAATNYFAYDFLRKLYKKTTHQDQVGNLPTLLIGSAAGAFASASTFPLEVARKHMQVGAISGRPAYDSLFHALSSILEQQGPAGLYRGLSASCFKLIPAAGISFMCYEACKRILIEDQEETS